MNNESLNLFLRVIWEKHSALKDRTDTLLKHLVGENIDSKKAATQATLQAATDLQAFLASKDVPDWLTSYIQHLPLYINGQWAAPVLLNHLIYLKPQLHNHQWSFESSDDSAFDFDGIFEHFKKESRLPQLFDHIVSILEEIQASGHVDSVTMLRALAKVIATMKRSKDGSYFSLHGAWEFLLSFLNNYMWGELSKLPILGTAMEALRKTIEDTNDEMSKLHQQIKDEMARTVETEVKALKDKATFPFIAYDKGGYLMPGPTTGLLEKA